MEFGTDRKHPLFMTDAQLQREMDRCEFCEEKPCQTACPAHCSPADFIMAARQGRPADYARAAGFIMAANPLGGVCGGVCPDTHCQAACSHRNFDWHIEIPSVQGAIIARAKKLGVMPKLEAPALNGHKIAVVGAGPAGLGAALELAQLGYSVEIFEESQTVGGACALIPGVRLDPEVLKTDIDWILSHPAVKLHTGVNVTGPDQLMAEGFSGVVRSSGLWDPIRLPIPGAELADTGNSFLAEGNGQNPGLNKVLVIGGGAIACDCAVKARGLGACVELVALETIAELPLTAKERRLLIEQEINVVTRTRVHAIEKTGSGHLAVHLGRVALPAGRPFHPGNVVDAGTSGYRLEGFDRVIFAIGNRKGADWAENTNMVLAGDMSHGPSTVVEAVASGKNAALTLHARLGRQPEPVIEKPKKSHAIIPGFNRRPVPLDVDFFGRTIPSPFLLSAAPPSDGYEQMKKALSAGWAGGIMKTAFDGIPIHIPADYMTVFNDDTYGNCDNVSGHSLERVCKEIGLLRREFPDRLIGGSTGGPVTGNWDSDRLGWQKNSRKLEQAGAQAIEFSLSCPQGGDGTEGAIVSQSAALTARIIDWVMETSDPDVPKLFKLTAAVTSIAQIIRAVKEVLDRYPGKKAGVTLANTFPVLGFRPRTSGEGRWDEGIVYGMSGAGVAPISNLTLASVAGLGVTVSGNGGPMDYYAAAHFLALGARTVQFCTVAEKYGVGYIEEMHSGLSFMLKARGFQSVEDLIGSALPKSITDFMELTPDKRISDVNKDICQHCGNCTRCPYLAISLGPDKVPVTDPKLCIGCSLCTQKCFANALFMRPRTLEEASVLVEH